MFLGQAAGTSDLAYNGSYQYDPPNWIGSIQIRKRPRWRAHGLRVANLSLALFGFHFRSLNPPWPDPIQYPCYTSGVPCNGVALGTHHLELLTDAAVDPCSLQTLIVSHPEYWLISPSSLFFPALPASGLYKSSLPFSLISSHIPILFCSTLFYFILSYPILSKFPTS